MIARVGYTERLEGTLDPPSSKNYTARYILAACLAEGESVVSKAAESDDAEAMIQCCQSLGATIRRRNGDLHITGFGRRPRSPGRLNPRNAGAVLRFLLAVGALLPEVTFETDFPESLGKRPNQDLLDALTQLGVRCESQQGRLPITLHGGRLRGGEISVSGVVSSQYVSALLFLAPLIGQDVSIRVINGLKSRPAIRTTLEVVHEAGIEVDASDDLMYFSIREGQAYRPRRYDVHGDYPGAAAILAAATIVPSQITITRLYEDQQGERAALDVLRSTGARLLHQKNTVTLTSSGKGLRAVEFNGDLATDAVLPLVGAACFARGTSRFYNVENLRHKECDRISVPVRELTRIGVKAEERPDEIVIFGNPAGYDGGVRVDSHNDHRVVMLLAIVGLRCRNGLVIENAHHVAKSYPNFFRDLQSLGAAIELSD
jgi:3-phosphoshikimate 1-carboxyvinyltransferase